MGARLPSEDALSARFCVSRHTVREALRRLRDDNLVASQQGSGSVVLFDRSGGGYAHDVVSINDLVSWSIGRRFAIDSMEVMSLSEAMAARAGLPQGDSWLVVRGFGHEQGVDIPTCWAEYYIHRDFAAVGRLLRRHHGPIFPLIEDLFGVKVLEVHQEIGATLIDATLASVLAVAPGSAGLEVRRCYKLAGGKLAQVTISTHPHSRYRHASTLRRVQR